MIYCRLESPKSLREARYPSKTRNHFCSLPLSNRAQGPPLALSGVQWYYQLCRCAVTLLEVRFDDSHPAFPLEMEIYVPSLPAGTSTLDLVEYLAPLLHHPPIAVRFTPSNKMNFTTNIWSFRNRYGRGTTSANVLLADSGTGVRFLARYGGRNGGLSLKGQPLSFSRSNKAPSKQALRKVQTEPFIE